MCNVKLNETLVALSFSHNTSEHAIYPHGKGASRLPMEVYIDNLIISSSLRMMFTRSQSLSKRWPLGSRWVIWKSVLFLAAKKNYARTWFSNNMNSTVSVSELDLHWDRTFRCTIGILLLTSSAVQYNISYIASTSPPSITSKFKIQQTKRKYTDVSQFRKMVWVPVPENKTKCC